MWIRRLRRALGSSVARRLSTAFILCAVLPLASLAVVTSIRTRAALDQQARERLHADAKSTAMDGLARLAVFESELRLAGSALVGGRRPFQAVLALFATPPDFLVAIRPDGTRAGGAGEPRDLSLTPAQRRHVIATGRLLLDQDASVQSAPVLIVGDLHDAPGALAAAAVDVRLLFGLDGALLPPAIDLCVYRTTAVLACTPDAPLAIAEQAARDPQDTDVQLEAGGGPFLVNVRTLPLGAVYGSGSWRLITMRPTAAVREPMRRFTQDFWLVVVLAFLLVGWVSFSQVRRQLRPLDALMAATTRLQRRDFSEPITLKSADEFEVLGQAFNTLSAELARQFADLETFSLGTLDTLARAIDAKSHWTAGHSDRVTAMAVAIAEAMGLPEDEVADLRRGGPVHDIGKLATPPEILDKPGALTPEEFAIMKQHTTKGVEILRPIAAFERLLPIVGQHHERWDGRGYPDGLAGMAIARTARVLAVADVYDALRSDRPYRPGRDELEVLQIITDGAGSHFDPAAVDAFLTVIAARDTAAHETPRPQVMEAAAELRVLD